MCLSGGCWQCPQGAEAVLSLAEAVLLMPLLSLLAERSSTYSSLCHPFISALVCSGGRFPSVVSSVHSHDKHPWFLRWFVHFSVSVGWGLNWSACSPRSCALGYTEGKVCPGIKSRLKGRGGLHMGRCAGPQPPRSDFLESSYCHTQQCCRDSRQSYARRRSWWSKSEWPGGCCLLTKAGGTVGPSKLGASSPPKPPKWETNTSGKIVLYSQPTRQNTPSK